MTVETNDLEVEYWLALSGLTDQARALVTGEDGYTDPWRATCALARHCQNAELTYEQYVLLAEHSPIASGSDGRRSRDSRKESKLEKAWRYVSEHDREVVHSADDVRRRLAELVHRVEQGWWQGRSGSTDKAVALSVVGLAHERGTFTPDLPIREISLRAGKGHDTVNRSFKRLAAKGLIEPVEGERQARHARRWRINLEWRRTWYSEDANGSFRTHKYIPPSKMGLCVPFLPLISHPVFLHRAIGSTAGRLYFGLGDREVTAREAAPTVGVSEHAARTNLNRLAHHGLAVRSDGRPTRYRVVDVSVERLNELAVEYGTLDWYDRKEAEYERHRAGQEMALALKAQKEAASTPPPF